MPTLVEAIEAATDRDLADVEAKIQEHSAKLASYQAAKRLLETRLGRREQPKPGPRPAASAKPSSVDRQAAQTASQFESRMKIARFLMERGGSARPMEIVNGTGIPQGSSTRLLDYDWFARQDDKVYITPAGRQACG